MRSASSPARTVIVERLTDRLTRIDADDTPSIAGYPRETTARLEMFTSGNWQTQLAARTGLQ